jgi:adenylosuccinate synthase
MVSTSGSSGTHLRIAGFPITRRRWQCFAGGGWWREDVCPSAPRFGMLWGTHQTPPIIPVSPVYPRAARPVCATLGGGLGWRPQIFQVESSLNSSRTSRGKTAVIVGAQWGDEGKGKIVDVLTRTFSVVARYAGGHNAGHTVIINGKKFILQLVPGGVLRPECTSVVGNGVVIDPLAFLKEVSSLRAAGVKVDGNLFVSNRAQVILPYHRMMELGSENAPGRVKIGTTSRGIGPTYEDKMGRRGLRVADLLDRALLRTHIENACREKNMIAHALFNADPLDADKMFREYSDAAEQLAPFVRDTALLLNRALAEGKSIVFEGAQGTMLDIDHGTYPFVTSSSATSGGAATGTGVPPTSMDTVIGITKAYCTRVGSGPFPTELLGAEGEDLRKRGSEFGAVTGRPRRTGWLDLPLLRYAGMINGISWLVVTKLDVLDHLTEIPVCVGYKVDGKETDEVPAQACGYEKIECIYRKLPGWASPTQDVRTVEGLPKAARDYLSFIEKETGARMGMISTGPDREQTILVDGFVSELGLARN